jgi:hypothetical protein
MIAIATYATKSFLYAIEDQAALVLAATRYAQLSRDELTYILVTDNSQEGRDAAETIKSMLPYHFVHRPLDIDENTTGKHNTDGNITIAAMQHEALHEARLIDADLFWSVEADILPNANTLQCLMDTLAFDQGYYDVAMAAYPNASFLGGHGTARNNITPNVYDDERKVSKDLSRRLKSKNKETREKAEAELKEAPANGNIFARQAKGWRPRGWLEEAYPGVGCGAILPTDWIGMGCTLFSRRAMNLANFTGYQGAGTQDLWLGWRCLHQHGLRFAVVPHALASHLKPVNGKMTLMHAYHELDGPTKGHLRMSKIDQSQKEDTLEP